MNVRLVLVVIVVAIATHLSAQEKGTASKGDFKSLRDKASYGYGMTMGNGLKKQGIEIDVDLLIQGLRDAAINGKSKLTDEQAFEAIQTFEKELLAKQAEESKKFLVDNKKRPGVKTTPSGLQYKILKAGKGAKPKDDDVVGVNYRASFVNGTEFESTNGKKYTIPVADVLPGWQEALKLMEIGSKWQLFIPPNLGYGEQGSPPVIAPNTTLVFEIELVDISKPGNASAKKELPQKQPSRESIDR